MVKPNITNIMNKSMITTSMENMNQNSHIKYKCMLCGKHDMAKHGEQELHGMHAWCVCCESFKGSDFASGDQQGLVL